MGPAAREYAPGTLIPGSKYRVVHRIGGGGMATVYDVVDTSVDRVFVLKVLHPQLGDNEDLARRLLKEARTLGRLHHTNIVEVITAGVTEDDLHLPYYVMERLNGPSIRIILEKKGQIDLSHAVHIAIDLLDALDHAHDAGVIHRDVKPDNIVLHKTPANLTVTKLLDFGIMSMLGVEKRETAGRFLGTLRYAAPEQLQGANPTRQMDVYCAALVLYEMASGRGPFDDLRDSMEIARAHIGRRAPRLSQFVVVPDELDRLLAAALDKDPDKRPRDAYSFAASLRNLKRTLGPSPVGFENLSSGATGLAALDIRPQPAAAVVKVEQPAPGGQYIVSPGPPVAFPVAAVAVAVAVGGQVPEQRTTVRGMSAPPEGAPSQAITTMGEVEPVDRGAATNTSAEPPPTLPMGSTLRISAPAPEEVVAPIQWPPERPAARSDEAQIRSIPVPAPAKSARAVVIAVTTVVGLGLAASALLLLRHAGDQTTPPAAAASIGAPVPLPEPVVTMPAPTLAPPALDDVPAPSTSASTSGAKQPAPKPKTTITSKPPAAAAVAPAPAPVPAPTSAPAPPDRPGPGF